MPSPFRRGAPRTVAPADVVARAGLSRGDKVLAAARADDGTWLVASRTALVLVPPADPPAGEPGVTTLPWQDIESAGWDRDADRFRVSEVGEYGRPRARHAFTLPEASDLLPVVRERVTASVVLQRRVAVRGRRGLTVVARRAPNTDADLTWSYELDAGLDPDDPEVRDLAERGLRAAAEELGL
jgi:hypothetical protein